MELVRQDQNDNVFINLSIKKKYNYYLESDENNIFDSENLGSEDGNKNNCFIGQ